MSLDESPPPVLWQFALHQETLDAKPLRCNKGLDVSGKLPSMCLVVIDIRAPGLLTILANRDEFYQRPTEPLHFWFRERIYAGKDLKGGGTWLGISTSGRFGALTNYRDPAKNGEGRQSRGGIIPEFLTSRASPSEFLNGFASRSSNYNPFNLVLGNKEEILYFSSISMEQQALTSGVYGLSNHLLDTPWFKLLRSKQLYKKRQVDQLLPNTESLFELLTDRKTPDPDDLPKTGVSLEWEKILSSIFISSTEYGTRSSSVLRISPDCAEFTERTYTAEGTNSSDHTELVSFDN